MSTTLLAMRSYVRNQTLVETDDVSNANLDIMLNAGLNQLSLAWNWPFLQATATLSTVADTQTIAVPADFRKAYLLYETDTRVRLKEVTFEQAISTWGGDPPAGDEARWFYFWNNTFYLIPIPATTESAEYTLFYQKAITELSADGDTPEFVSEFHLLPTQYAIARVWEHEEDFPKATEADTQFREQVEQMARYYQNLTEDSPSIFGDGVRPSLSDRNNMPWLDKAT